MPTFIKITNKQVFDRIEYLDKNNRAEHQELLVTISSYKSQVSRLYWAVGACVSLNIAILFKILI